MTLRLGSCALAFPQAPALSGGPDGRGSFKNARLGCPAPAPTFGSSANVALGKTKKRARRHNIDVSVAVASSYGEPKAVSSQHLASISLEEEKDKALLIANNHTLQDEKSMNWSFPWPVHKWRGDHTHMQRDWFPQDFSFGAATSAFQIEGATNQKEYGRGPSIWDTFVKTQPDKIADHANADTAIEGYRRYKEDVGIMKEMNLNAYRFSISWSRILPTGRRSGGINVAGVEHYQNLINDLKAKGVEPFVTLFHWDLPQALEDQYTGFLSPLFVDDFRDYADICFKLFGDRVKNWITFNEPSIFCKFGYGTAAFAPGRSSNVEPYIVAHHLMLAHAAAVDQYRKHYKGFQKGKIGITFQSNWYLPLNDSNSDKEAVSRVLDFELGWFMDPLTTGDYPFIMRALLGNRLPSFTTQQSELLRESFDFIGINYYSSSYASSNLVLGSESSFDSDSYVWKTGMRDGKPIGDPTTTWIFVCPWGIRDLLKYVKEKYRDPIIYITENGFGFNDEDTNSGKPESLHDHGRTDYLKKHLYNVGLAGSEGVRVKGYLIWSLFDNFEWASGYTVRFGIIHIDFKNLSRHWKDSAKWYHMFLKHPISGGPIFPGTPISGDLSNSDP